MNNQNRTPLFDALVEYNRRKPAYFRVPGHRYENGINPILLEAVGDAVFSFDLTETPLLDDLHNATGPIREAEQLAADLWGADYTHFLVNGTTCGNEAMILTALHGGGTVAVPRNAHKSALMGLILSGGNPAYIMPELEEEWGLHGGVHPDTVEEVFRIHPDCKGVLIVSPTYYGIASDLKSIAEICHRHDAILMVDEAHGAHCYFSDDFPKGALELGADVCVQSIHKVAGSLTQSSMLHVKSDRIKKSRMDSNLTLVQSTSPSYLLMLSLDMARHDIARRGKQMIDRAAALAANARERINAIPGMACAGRELIGKAAIFDYDVTRLIVSANAIGITGFDLQKMLFSEYNIDMELANYRNVLGIVTFANEQENLDVLVDALADIAHKHRDGSPLPPAEKLPPQPEYVLSPRNAYFSDRERIPWVDAKGRIASEMIAPYPPGIPVIYPGERVSEEVWDYVEAFRQRNGHLHGPSDAKLSTFVVVR
ncbi:MAG TPA: aminotransferase class V-fold PLP-dependent enzyme [Clostridiales bacterium]|nr:aminotransferase class V-fold PLP-dependent enzyme [Clostridiales bacterium]